MDKTAPSCISLITDFGFDSPFTGVVKGVIWSRFPQAKIIDLFHNVAAYNVAEAAFWLQQCYPYTPPATVHVAVVDPGVGTARRILAARHQQHVFLAPDNGLLAQMFANNKEVSFRELDVPALQKYLHLPEASTTFHGRDIFAPVAAALASGACLFEALGDTVSDIVPSSYSAAYRTGDEIHGVVISIDHYGNLITNIDRSLLQGKLDAIVECDRNRFQMKRTYGEAASGECIALINSFNVLEIACVQGNAADLLVVKRGTPIKVLMD